MGDVFVMPCRNRWAGLEQEGFGIVFTEAAASGVPQIAGRSGGAHEAVVDGVTGIVVDEPREAREVADAILSILQNSEQANTMSAEGRKRSVDLLSYDLLADRLMRALT
jgi:phosphatidylinositol alpha-1,6-mannosyltransferase